MDDNANDGGTADGDTDVIGPHGALPEEDESRADRVVRAFLERILADQDEGRPRTLSEYQSLYPGHEARIAAEHRRVFSTPGGAPEGAPDGIEDDAEERLDTPARIGPYPIIRRLGQGGQGVVYLAEDERLRRQVAIKVLRDRPGERERGQRRFLREARATSRLDHPGIAAIYDSGLDGDVAYLVMRYVEGRSLQGVLDERAPGTLFDPGAASGIREVATFVERAARAVAVAHAAGVLHRDLKPGNLMVGTDGAPVVLDFGLAGSTGDDQTVLTRTGELFGTPAYMAPEQLEGGPLGPAIDVYALGVTLYEALTGARPFDAPSREALYRAILSGNAVDPRRLNPRVPKDLALVVQTAMERDPARRYATCAAFAEDLRRFLEGRPILARPVPVWMHVMRWGAHNVVASTALVALFVVISTALAITSSANRRLREQIGNITAGQEALLQRKIDDLLIDGYQRGFSVDSEPGKESFRAALALDPQNADALAGALLLEMPDVHAAAALLDRYAGALAGDPILAAMRATVQSRAPADAPAVEAAGSAVGTSSLAAFLAGHRAVRNFMPPVDRGAARVAMTWFRAAIRRAQRPRFHYWHSLMMAAREAGDRDTLEECDDALRHHWPRSPGTYEALAQFWFPFDDDRAIAAGRELLSLTDCASGHLLLAEWHRKHGRFDEACEEYARARALSPHLMAVHATEAMGMVQMGRLDAAILRLETALASLDSPELRALLGQLEASRAKVRGGN